MKMMLFLEVVKQLLLCRNGQRLMLFLEGVNPTVVVQEWAEEADAIAEN